MAKKEEKKAFVLRINQRTLHDLEKWAADDFRSLNGQIEWLLQKTLKEAGRLGDSKPEDDSSI